MTFGRLTVIKRIEDFITEDGKAFAQYLCSCSCEENKFVKIIGNRLTRKNGPRSCGCLRKETAAKNVLKVQPLAVKVASINNKKYNDVILNLEDKYGLYGIGFCHNTGRKFYFDMKDYDRIKDICWNEQIQDSFSTLQGRDLKTNNMVRMHSFLGYVNYDHEDRNELNNRAYNLRPATIQENARNHNKQKNNTTGVIGVGRHKQAEKWRAYIYINKKHVGLGLFENKDDAIYARLSAEKEYFKEFAPQKHLFEQYGIKGE